MLKGASEIKHSCENLIFKNIKLLTCFVSPNGMDVNKANW